jgi:hypothetical protein
MTTTQLVKSLLAAALLACTAAHAAEQPIVVAMEQGKPVASFTLGDSRCVLKDDRIRCTPANK